MSDTKPSVLGPTRRRTGHLLAVAVWLCTSGGTGGCGGGDPATPAGENQREATPGLAGMYQSTSLFSSRLAECARYQDALSGEVRRHLARLSEVRVVSALVSVPACDSLAVASGAVDAPSASVIVGFSSEQGTREPGEIAGLVAAAVAGLTVERVAVSVTAAPVEVASEPAPALTSVGPFVVVAESRWPLRITGLALLGLIFSLAVWAFFGERLNRKLRARLTQLEQSVRDVQDKPLRGQKSLTE